MKKGKVYFVGAGAGNIDLFTLKGKQVMETADCIIYDKLIDNRILKFAKEEAQLIYVGKENTAGGKTQELINSIIVEKYLEGKTVVRLKGGDPFVFGRGGEEILSLEKYNPDFEVIPGISSSIAVPEYAGIPVTHRGVSNSFHVFTGHLSDESENLKYESIAPLEGTLIFLMGVKNLPNIAQSLVQYGKNKETPVAIIESGASNNQKVTLGTLDTIVSISEKNNVVPPAIIVIGEVVNLREKLKWLENKPLYGKSILVTRDSANNSDFSNELLQLGAKVYELPFIKIEKNGFSIDTLKNYSAILFNSPNGVKFFMEQIKDIRVLGNIKIGSVGEKTTEELKKYMIIPDFAPEKYMMEELVKDSLNCTDEDSNILIVTSNISPCEINDYSKKYNRNFEKIIAYNTDKIINSLNKTTEYINKVEYITFLSSSAVESFSSSIENNTELLKNKKIISIGEITSKTLAKYGLTHYLEAKSFSAKGIIEIIKGDKNIDE